MTTNITIYVKYSTCRRKYVGGGKREFQLRGKKKAASTMTKTERSAN